MRNRKKKYMESFYMKLMCNIAQQKQLNVFAN